MQPVDHAELSRATSNFLHLYFKDELPRMGFPHYHGVGLSTEEVLQRQRQRRLRARRLQNTTNIDQEFLMGGNATFVGEPTPDTELLDNLRSAAFAGATSKAAYLDALQNSNDPGLQSTTTVIVHERDSTFSPTPTERISPGAYSTDREDDKDFNSYVIATMTAVSFIIIGSALFLYNRKTMRDREEKDMMSLNSDEAPDSVLLKGDLGCSDSTDSQNSTIKVPAELDIQPVPISLIRDSKTLERALIRANRNRSVIEKANEKVERKSIIMTKDNEDDKTISFAEIIAKSVSQSPRVSSQLQLEPMVGPMKENNEDLSVIEKKECDSSITPLSIANLASKSSDSLQGLQIVDGGSKERNAISPPPEKEKRYDAEACCTMPQDTCCDTNGIASQARALVTCSPTNHHQFCGEDDDDYSYHEGPTTDNSMAKPAAGIPTIELPPVPITMAVDKISPNYQQVINALAEGSPSTPFSLITYSVHTGDEEPQQTTRMPYGVSSSIDRALLESPSQEGQELALVVADENSPRTPRLGIAASPNVSIVARESSPRRLGIAASPNVSISYGGIDP